MFLAKNPNETTHAIKLVHPFNTAHSLIISLQLSRVTTYYDVYSPSVEEYENYDVTTIHLTAEKLPCDPSTNEYSERKTQMTNH